VKGEEKEEKGRRRRRMRHTPSKELMCEGHLIEGAIIEKLIGQSVFLT